MSDGMAPDVCDVFVIGGGINGCAIARDAAGRGLAVQLAEMGDLGQATSSSSTKLFHGGLRYLEFFEFTLVRDALRERETLLRAMPHISWPMRFVLPYHPDQRFDAETPTSRLLNRVMPWMRGRRPAWLIRAGLFLYDRLGGRSALPPTRALDLSRDPAGTPLKPRYARAFEYSDCWVEDSRLVALTARDAAERGAAIKTGARVTLAEREGSLWRIQTTDREGGSPNTYYSRVLVNASGPWVGNLISDSIGIPSTEDVRLVRGSHIVTRRLYEHERCYFFQGRDGRIIFAIPYEDDFTLIGTTDQEHEGDPMDAVATEAEQAYLCAFASEYFERPVTRDDIVWTYSGVRPLYDDGASSATAATRDYVLSLDDDGPPVLNVFGGKITTHRRLAEQAVDRLVPYFANKDEAWTAGVPLPGGDFDLEDKPRLVVELMEAHPWIAKRHATRLIRAYGTDAARILDGAHNTADLGRDFGATLTEREVVWLMDREYARRADDVLWRRTKLGLRLGQEEAEVLDAWMKHRRAARETAAA